MNAVVAEHFVQVLHLHLVQQQENRVEQTPDGPLEGSVQPVDDAEDESVQEVRDECNELQPVGGISLFKSSQTFSN